jgi:hypothetical protein
MPPVARSLISSRLAMTTVPTKPLPYKLPNGNLMIPVRIPGQPGQAAKEVEPGTIEYQQWVLHIDDDEDEQG